MSAEDEPVMTTVRNDAVARHRAPRALHRSRRPWARVVGDAALSMLALGGVVCIILVVLAATFHVTLIMFKTGSMSPTIPAGSVAVVREIPATDIAVGDVVTVDRAGLLPVTHRVTSVAETAGAPDARTITMQGDANPTPDPQPYVVERVRVVLASVPHLASVIVWFSNPVVLGGVTVATSALVMWAFWPRRDDEERGPRGGDGGRSTGRVAAAGTALLVAASAVVVPAPEAAADTTETVVRSRFLTLRSVGDESLMRGMTPGRPVTWDVHIAADTPEPSEVTIGFSQRAAADAAFHSEVRACAEPWTTAGCGSGEVVLREQQAVSTLARTGLMTMSSDDERSLRVTVTLLAAPDAGTADIELRVHAWTGGDGAVIGEGPSGPDGDDGRADDLAVTGAEPLLAALLAAAAVGSGLLAAHLGSRIRRAVEVER